MSQGSAQTESIEQTDLMQSAVPTTKEKADAFPWSVLGLATVARG